MTRKRIILLTAAAAVFLVLAFGAWQGARAWWAWRGIERVEFNTVEARAQLTDPTDATPAPTHPTVEYDAVLAIGSDRKPDEEMRRLADQGKPFQEGEFADAILLWLAPTDGGDPSLVSIPRDLLVINPCTGEETKIDRTLAGCGDKASGPELVALAVEDYTGIAVDHFATFGFEAFVDVIDSLGGVDVCVEHALRRGARDLLPAGCSTIDGETALVWVRSRDTQEFVNGEWRFIEGVSDRTRSETQQQLMFAMLARLKAMRSPVALAGIAESVGDRVVLSKPLSMGDAIAMAWDLRSMSSASIRRIIVPTEPAVTPDGAFALRATVAFSDLLED